MYSHSSENDIGNPHSKERRKALVRRKKLSAPQREKMNVKANEIPTARFCPIPPLRFCEESDNAKIDKMKIDTGIEVRWWSSFR